MLLNGDAPEYSNTIWLTDAIRNIAASVHTLTLCYNNLLTLQNTTSGTLMISSILVFRSVKSLPWKCWHSTPQDFYSSLVQVSKSHGIVLLVFLVFHSQLSLHAPTCDAFVFTRLIGSVNPKISALSTTTHFIFQLDNVNSRDKISSPQLSYLDSLEVGWTCTV